MRINAVSTIPFQKKFRVNKEDKSIDKALLASTVAGSYSTASAVGVGIAGTDLTSTALSSDVMGTNSLGIVPVSLDLTGKSSPALALSVGEHQSTASTGLFSSRTMVQGLNDRFSKKIIPSLEESLDAKGKDFTINTHYLPFEHKDAIDVEEIQDEDKSDNDIKYCIQNEISSEEKISDDVDFEDKYTIVDKEMDDFLFAEDGINLEIEDI